MKEELFKLLPKEFKKEKIYYFETISSTNDVAFNLAQEGAEEGTVVIARSQSKGRGRLQRRWHSPEGGLWFSFILRPNLPPSSLLPICIVCALSISKTLEKLFSLPTKVKWPNDVLVNGRKICGILLEASTSLDNMEFLIAGIGLNANIESFPPPLSNTATSLMIELGKDVNIPALFWSILQNLFSYYKIYKNEGFLIFKEELEKYNYLLGKRVSVETPSCIHKGVVLGISDRGALVLEEDGEKKEVIAGDVQEVGADI